MRPRRVFLSSLAPTDTDPSCPCHLSCYLPALQVSPTKVPSSSASSDASRDGSRSTRATWSLRSTLGEYAGNHFCRKSRSRRDDLGLITRFDPFMQHGHGHCVGLGRHVHGVSDRHSSLIRQRDGFCHRPSQLRVCESQVCFLGGAQVCLLGEPQVRFFRGSVRHSLIILTSPSHKLKV